MTEVLIALLAAAAGGFGFGFATLARSLRYQARDAARREQQYGATIKDLNDRLMYMIDRPWNPPPDEQVKEPPPDPEIILMPDDYRLETETY